MSGALLKLAAAALTVAAAVGAVRLAAAADRLASADDTARAAREGTPARIPLHGRFARPLHASAGERVHLGSLQRAVVLVFDPRCGPSNANFWNWVDLAGALRGGGVELVALGTARPDEAADYWAALAPEPLRVLLADTAILYRDLRQRLTPATLLVEDGWIVRQWWGLLDPAEKETIVALASAPRREALQPGPGGSRSIHLPEETR